VTSHCHAEQPMFQDTSNPNAEYLHLSEDGRHYRIEHRSARSGGPSALPATAESCVTRCDCSRRGHGDAAVQVDDPPAGQRSAGALQVRAFTGFGKVGALGYRIALRVSVRAQ
jgi:hypothetical protein